MSQWADAHRYLSPESSPEPGPWHTDRTPYLREVMDCLADPFIEFVCMMTSSQVGKTECGLNWIGQTIDIDPVPMLIVVPNLDDARTFSKIRLQPMLRDCPVLRGKVTDARGKKRENGSTSNETTHKTFPGGHLTIVGSNSPSGLASKPIARAYVDELDRFELSAGDEGDQIQLIKRRTQNFWNRKIFITSTPGVKGISKIESTFNLSTQKRFHVPCPHCSFAQVLKFGNLKWDKKANGDHDFRTVHFECVNCQGKILDKHKAKMLDEGEWIADNPSGEYPGYHIWAAYSPWVSWEKLAREFVTATHQGEEALKAFVNTVLGETWEEKGEAPEWTVLQQRADLYMPGTVPDHVLFLVAGVDVQADRVEIGVWGYGPYEESWAIAHEVIYGDMESDEMVQQLDNYLLFKTFPQPTKNRQLPISLTCIDSGAKTQAVYKYARTRHTVRAVRGSNQPNAPRIARPSFQDINWRGEKIEKGIKLWLLGTHVIKSTLYSRLRIKEVGPRFMHFSQDLPDEWYRQLTAERLVTRYDKNHQAKQEWVKIRQRNEVLDCATYAYAAALMIGLERIPWDHITTAHGGAAPVQPATPLHPQSSAQEATSTRPQQVRSAPESRRFGRPGGKGAMGRLLRN